MSKIESLRQTANQIVNILRQYDNVLAIWFYGAAQRNQTWQESDVDLLILTEECPQRAESRVIENDVIIHLHWIARAEFEHKIAANQDRILHGRVGGGELLYDGDGQWTEMSQKVSDFPISYRFYHMMPHLNALLYWARDLRKRMALRDERPRRASARQWVVDIHSASILLIEKGDYPHNEPTTQALNARIFVPNMASPKEIEEFVAERLAKWLIAQLRMWNVGGDFDAALLQEKYGVEDLALLLDFAARQGVLQVVKSKPATQMGLEQLAYRFA